MFYVSEIKREAPEVFATPLQKKVYETLAQNNIPFGRVDTDPGITMEDCRNIDAAIGERIVKTVFLCFIKLDKSDLLDKFLPACGHVSTII